MQREQLDNVKKILPSLSEEAAGMLDGCQLDSADQLFVYALYESLWTDYLPGFPEKDKELIIQKSYEHEYYSNPALDPAHVDAAIYFRHTWSTNPAWRIKNQFNRQITKQIIEIDRLNRKLNMRNYDSTNNAIVVLTVECDRAVVEDFFKKLETIKWEKDEPKMKFDSNRWDVELHFAGNQKDLNKHGFDEAPRGIEPLKELIQSMITEFTGKQNIHLFGR